MTTTQAPIDYALLSTTQLGKLMGKDRSTIYRWIACGIIPEGSIIWSGRKALVRRSWLAQVAPGASLEAQREAEQAAMLAKARREMATFIGQYQHLTALSEVIAVMRRHTV